MAFHRNNSSLFSLDSADTSPLASQKQPSIMSILFGGTADNKKFASAIDIDKDC